MAFPMIVFPALQTLPRYFDKRLVFASALIFCGQSAGSILIPYLLSVVVPIYGVSGSFIIIAAINLHTFVAAALLRPCVPESIQTITVQNDPTSKPRCEKYESENE